MDFNSFRSIGKQNKTAQAIVKQLAQKVRGLKGGIIDLSHFRTKVRKAAGFSHQDYDAFWKTLARRGYGEYAPAEKKGEHAKFIPSNDIVEFAKMATGQIPTSITQETYNQANPASATTEGPVFQIATLIMKNLRQMSAKEVQFLIDMLENRSQFS